MDLFKRLTQTLAPQSVTLRFTPDNDGVLLKFWRGQNMLTIHELDHDTVGKKLPKEFLGYLRKVLNPASGQIIVPYPQALRIIESLKRHPLERFELDATAIEKLMIGTCPIDFRIEYRYDASSYMLVRHVIGAGRHLGNGWFQRGDHVFQYNASLDERDYYWLNMPAIANNQVFEFLSHVLPTWQRAHYPVECDLRITPLTFTLRILTMRLSLLQFAVDCNHPELLVNLRPLPGDNHHMISGSHVIPFGQQLLAKQLWAAALNGDKTLMGEEIPAFIQDEVRPRSNALGVDLDLLLRTFPVVDAAQLKLTWNLKHSVVQGIGKFVAVLGIQSNGRFISLHELRNLAEQSRFLLSGNVWFEFTAEFKRKTAQLLEGHKVEHIVTSAELLGFNAQLIAQMGIRLPALDVELSGDEVSRVQQLLDAMRANGVPVGISGLQNDLPRMLAQLVLRVASAYTDARVLWIVSKKRKPVVQEASVNLLKAQSARTARGIAQRLTIISPDELRQEFAKVDWTLVIFHDLDQMVPSANFARAYGSLRRLWSVAVFTSAQWYTNKPLLERVLQSLQLSSDNADQFLVKCCYTFSNQQQNLLERLTSPFKRISVDTGTSEGNVKIPPRQTGTPFSPEPSARDLTHPSFGWESDAKPIIRVSTNATSFVEEARRYTTKTSPRVDPVPFMQYYPTYGAMSPQQQHWYFYWREQVRQGNTLPTDLSYIFVHVYEVLNLVGFKSPQSAFDYLVDVWTRFRSLQPKLDKYLPDWITDFIVVHHLPIQPLDWYARILSMGIQAGDPDFIFTAWVQGREYQRFPNEVLYRLIGYTPSKSKFLREQPHPESIEESLVAGIHSLDDWLRQNQAKGLYEQFELPFDSVHRQPFAGAIHAYEMRPVYIAEVKRWSQSELFARQMVEVLKYTENILRDRAGYKSKLRGIDLPAEWKRTLDTFFGVKVAVVVPPAPKGRGRPRKQETLAQPPVRAEFSFDPDAAQRLEAETALVRDRLIVEEDTPTKSEPAVVLEMTSTVEPVPDVVVPYTIRPADTPEGLLTDLVPVAAIMGDADSVVAALLRELRRHDWHAAPIALEKLIESGFLNVHLDHVNEQAIEQLGDQLIIWEDGGWVVAEDYRDEIDHILDHPTYVGHTSERLVSSPSVPAIVNAEVYQELEEEWVNFVATLRSHHWEAIAALLGGVDVSARLDAIARAANITHNLLIDDINNAALEAIGDIVIDTMEDPPRIEDEDVDSLARLLSWATQRQILEH